jgi:broad specificity phosphatase PhoE
MKEMPIAFLSRHGETELNVDNILKGFLDSPLTQKGMEQAEAQAKYLAPFPIIQIYCSPLLRAFQTASFTAAALQLTPIQDRGLATWHVGVLEGVNKDNNREAIQLFLDNPSVRIPDGESIEDFEDRVSDFFAEKLKMAEENGLFVFFTHNSTISAFSNMLTGKRDEIVELGDVIPTGGVAGIYPNGKSYRLEALFVPEKEETPQ